MKMTTRRKALFLVVLVFVILITSSGCGIKAIEGKPLPTVSKTTPRPIASLPPVVKEMHAYFLDVGQGDSILLVSPNDKTMLIDAGTSKSYEIIQDKLQELEIEKLDCVIATHPHADHIGSMTSIIENYEIESFYLPECDTETKTYTNMMNALDEKDIEYQYLYANLEVPWDEEVEVRVLSPVQGVNYGAIINNYSIMLHITYGETSMLLAGDAEKKAEQKVLETFESIQADVLKAGHHGSDTSSTRDFIEAVSPELVIISVGADNKYDHPSKKTMDLFEELGIQVMRTDLDGTIHLIFSGLGYKVAEELEEVEE